MTLEQPAGQDPLSAYRDEIGPDDGLDPRKFLRRTSGRVTNRKALQLCAQVRDILDYVFAWDCGDRLLKGLMVASVTPAPNASRLLVTVYLPEELQGEEPAQILDRLNHAHGRLRSEVAAAIHRRRVPELSFRIATPEGA
jgi:ribosome-binding factor A